MKGGFISGLFYYTAFVFICVYLKNCICKYGIWFQWDRQPREMATEIQGLWYGWRMRICCLISLSYGDRMLWGVTVGLCWRIFCAYLCYYMHLWSCAPCVSLNGSSDVNLWCGMRLEELPVGGKTNRSCEIKNSLLGCESTSRRHLSVTQKCWHLLEVLLISHSLFNGFVFQCYLSVCVSLAFQSVSPCCAATTCPPHCRSTRSVSYYQHTCF